MSKVCIDCGKILPLDAFYAKKDAKDRHSPYCKECQKLRTRHARWARQDMERYG